MSEPIKKYTMCQGKVRMTIFVTEATDKSIEWPSDSNPHDYDGAMPTLRSFLALNPGFLFKIKETKNTFLFVPDVLWHDGLSVDMVCLPDIVATELLSCFEYEISEADSEIVARQAETAVDAARSFMATNPPETWPKDESAFDAGGWPRDEPIFGSEGWRAMNPDCSMDDDEAESGE